MTCNLQKNLGVARVFSCKRKSERRCAMKEERKEDVFVISEIDNVEPNAMHHRC